MNTLGLILIAPMIWVVASTAWIVLFHQTKGSHGRDSEAGAIAGLITTMFLYGIYFLTR